MATSRPGSWTGRGLNSNELKIPNSDTLRPMPNASVPIATAENPGFLKTVRNAYRIRGLTPISKRMHCQKRAISQVVWNQRLAKSGPGPVCAPLFGSGQRSPSRGRLIDSLTVSQRVLVGTSGYNYPEWRGTFYPEKFSTDKMLAYYAERFPTVEINYTFYRMPTEKLLAGWAAGTPDGFSFTLKAPRRITHDSKLQRCEDLLQTFCRTARTLGPRLATLLFQLPPTFKKDAAVLRSFVDLLPDGTRAAFEFRHPSWHDAEVFDVLKSRNAALCIA